MRKILIAWLMVFALFASPIVAQDVSVECSDTWSQHEFKDYPYYDLCYAEEIEAAEYVVWRLTRDEVLAPNVSRKNTFRPDPDISTGSADLIDYKNSGFDRGHMCPNNDRNYNNEAMSATFLMSNMSPQTPILNQQTWRTSESLTQALARELGYIDVVVGPIFYTDKKDIKTIGPNKVGVPDAYFRLLVNKETGYLKAYIIPQNCDKIPPKDKGSPEDYEGQLRNYECDLKAIEEATKLKFKMYFDSRNIVRYNYRK